MANMFNKENTQVSVVLLLYVWLLHWALGSFESSFPTFLTTILNLGVAPFLTVKMFIALFTGMPVAQIILKATGMQR